MDIRTYLKTLLEQAITEANFPMAEITLEHPMDMTFGDYATPVALKIAKESGGNPREIAEQITEKTVKESSELIQTVTVAGAGFINFTLTPQFFAEQLAEILTKKDAFGCNRIWQGNVLEVEHTSPNPNKAMHLGHLRNNVTGMALVRLFEANGARVIAESVDNDRGIAICKLMWGYLKFAKKKDDIPTDIAYWFEHQDEWQMPEDTSVLPDQFVDRLYVQGSEDCKNSEVSESIVRGMVVDFEAGEEKTRALWRVVLQYSHAGQERTLNRLGNRFDYVWHESDHYEMGKKIVEEGLAKGIFKKLEDGAILTDLSDYNLTDTIVQKADGTSLYLTQDLALTKLKKEKHEPTKMFWVIGPEQSLQMAQLFALCEQLGIGRRDEYQHIAYGYMSIKDQGKMSSRAGNVIYIDELIDLIKKRIEVLILRDDLTVTEKDDLAEKLALAAVKYSVLKTGRMTDVAFDLETSIDINGNSGPYLQYTHARIRSVLKKAEEAGIVPDESKGEAVNLVERLLYRYPEVVDQAAKEFAPNYIATYLYELASAFNAHYAEHRIVSEAADSPYQVALAGAVVQVLKNGLAILGIEAVEKM